jgi:DNA invertase Pin-like site-specific DNA recombinase
MVKAVGYVRVSSSRQASEGVSLEAQRGRIAAWCVANGYELERVYEDSGLSGSRADNRPGLESCLVHACRAKAALVTYALSRVARSTKDALAISERLSRAGADLVSLSERLDTTTAAGRMVFRVLAVLAEFERDLIAERTATAMRHKRARGEYTGGNAPYGWRIGPDGVALQAHPPEQQVIRRARALRSAGWSLRAIGHRLGLDGMPPRCLGAWHPKTVNDLLRAMTAEQA